MEKQIKILENGNIQIDNVVLTPKALSTLDFFQQDGSLNNRLDELADAICILAQAVDSYNGEFKIPVYKAITNLAYMRENLQDLAKTPPRLASL